ncbi:MAG: transcription antitermination factor NusB [Acidimicrobiales bacterium]
MPVSIPGAGRREARERALELLYEAESKAMSPTEVLAELAIDPDPYAVDVVRGVGDDQRRLDGLISATARGWTLDRMPVIDRNLLRMATWELAHRPEIPVAVIINEAVELAKQYSTDDSGRFVNGVLSRLAAELRSGEA